MGAAGDERGRKRGKRSDDRQALPALEAAGFDDFASAFGGHTGTITDLTGALFAVRAECWLHDFLRKRGSEVPEQSRGVKGRFVPASTTLDAKFFRPLYFAGSRTRTDHFLIPASRNLVERPVMV
jgi:hypothetical protein